MNEIFDIRIEKICAINEFASSEELRFRHKNRRWHGFVYFDEADGVFISEGMAPLEIKNSTLLFLNESDTYSILLKPGYRYIASAYKIPNDDFNSLSLLPRLVNCSKNEEAIIRNIYRVWCENNRHSVMDCKIQILSLYLGIIKKLSDKDERNDIIIRAEKYIQSNFRRNFSTAEIADFCGVSVSHLRAVFRKKTGSTIIAYRENQRVNEAKRMLLTSLFTLKEIAYELGYSDAYHFAKAFKKATGYTPGKFKKQG